MYLIRIPHISQGAHLQCTFTHRGGRSGAVGPAIKGCVMSPFKFHVAGHQRPDTVILLAQLAILPMWPSPPAFQPCNGMPELPSQIKSEPSHEFNTHFPLVEMSPFIQYTIASKRPHSNCSMQRRDEGGNIVVSHIRKSMN